MYRNRPLIRKQPKKPDTPPTDEEFIDELDFPIEELVARDEKKYRRRAKKVLGLPPRRARRLAAAAAAAAADRSDSSVNSSPVALDGDSSNDVLPLSPPKKARSEKTPAKKKAISDLVNLDSDSSDGLVQYEAMDSPPLFRPISKPRPASPPVDELAAIANQMAEADEVRIRFQYTLKIKRIALKTGTTLESNADLIKKTFDIPAGAHIILLHDYDRVSLESKCNSIPDFDPVTGLLKIDLMSEEEVLEKQKEKEAAEATAKPVDPNTVVKEGHIRIKTETCVKKSHANCQTCIAKCSTCAQSEFLMKYTTGRRNIIEEIVHIPEDVELGMFMNEMKNKFLEKNAETISTDDQSHIKFKFTFDCENLEPAQKPDDLDMEHGVQIEIRITDSRACREVSCVCKSAPSASAPEDSNQNQYVFLENDDSDSDHGANPALNVRPGTCRRGRRGQNGHRGQSGRRGQRAGGCRPQ